MDFKPADNLKGSRTRLDNKAFSSGASKGLSLRDRFQLDRLSSSSSDSYHNMRKKTDMLQATSSGDHSKNSKQRTERVNASDNDELVKHMSNLPSFLERGLKPPEKAFSVGVLDWSLLEKWQSGKQVPYRRDGSSSSNSMSSLFSTEGSSTSSITRAGQNSSGAHHEDRVPMLQFQNEGVLSETLSAGAKSSQNVVKKKLVPKLESNTRDDFGSNASSSVTFCSANHHLASYSNPRMRSSHVESEREVRKSRRSQSMSLNQQSAERDKKAFHVPPPDTCSGVSVSKCSKVSSGKRSSEEYQWSCTLRPREIQYAELGCDIPRSCPLSCDDERLSRTCRTNERSSATGTKQHSAKKPISSSKAKESDDVKLQRTTVIDILQGSKTATRASDATGTRCPSPTGRFNFGMCTVSRETSSTKDAEMTIGCSTADGPGKPGGKKEVYHYAIDDSSFDKPVSSSKARSSPLKRLLDPLLKSKEQNRSCASESLLRETTSVKTLERPSTAPGIRVGLSMSGPKSTSIHRSHQNGKDSGLSVVQALLQVVVQNDCPVFTFAVDGVKDLLCATLSKVISSKKFEGRYLYTLFSVHEIKDKRWINLSRRSTALPSIIAQMEVSETLFTNVADRQVFENCFVRNFILSSVKLIQGKKKDTQYQMNEELAAIVVNSSGLVDDKLQIDKFNGTSMTIILPGGTHTLPIKGKPSSLIERWRSGGACDCGGWDSGCKLRILTVSTCQSSCFAASSKFKLFEQGGLDGKQPIFNLAPYKEKDGVLAVSFNSSVSPLQAFSICLAVLDTRKQSTLLRPNYTPQEKPSEESDHGKPPNGVQVEVAGTFVSVPPHSPVGRV